MELDLIGIIIATSHPPLANFSTRLTHRSLLCRLNTNLVGGGAWDKSPPHLDFRTVSAILMGSLAQEGAPCFVVLCPLSWLPPSHPALSSACRLDGARAPREKGVCLDCRLLDTSRTAGVSSCKGTAALSPIWVFLTVFLGRSDSGVLVHDLVFCSCSALALLTGFRGSSALHPRLLWCSCFGNLRLSLFSSSSMVYLSCKLNTSVRQVLLPPRHSSLSPPSRIWSTSLCPHSYLEIFTLPSSVDGQDVVVDSTGCQDKNEEKTVPCSGVSCASPAPIPETHALPASAISMGSTGSRAQEGDIRGFVFRGWAPGVVSNASGNPFRPVPPSTSRLKGTRAPA
ncbi:hypothetical protein B0H13DRAFT_2316606 [Mycena leptocephala]|nr:hypothetical protein B0H13DRAFT_2316606 [Mycena leptocephala]